MSPRPSRRSPPRSSPRTPSRSSPRTSPRTSPRSTDSHPAGAPRNPPPRPAAPHDPSAPHTPAPRPPRPTRAERPAPRPPREALALPDFTAIAPLETPASFIESCASIGLEFEGDDTRRLGRFLVMLLAANDALNLTAVTDPEQAWTRHIFDSLTLIPALADLPDESRVIDVGTGGGLPGIPLAVCMPNLGFTLLEATGKKVLYLRAVADALSLSNVRVVEGRAEVVGHDRGERLNTPAGFKRGQGHRESYDAVTARAVGRLATLAELTVPFAKPGGRVLLIKGAQAHEELAEAAKALHLLKATHDATLDTPTGRIVVLSKTSATPKIYPRRDGEPKRSPLGISELRKPPTP